MFSEQDRSQLARYEAFLSLCSELISLSDPAQVARVMGQRLKYVVDHLSWRYLAVSCGGVPGLIEGDEARAEVLVAEGGRGEAGVASVGWLQLSVFERECWKAGRAASLDATALDERIESLPAPLRNPEIVQLHVHPQQGRGRLEALFLIAVRDAPLDAFDLKFIALTALFFHRKIDYLRMEKRMTDELVSTLDSLRQTRDDLIESEKLATLGSMVAGVSHELSTPISNAMLMSSSLLTHLRGLEALISGGSMRRSDIVRWQGGAIEMGQLLDSAVNRAAALVGSFKQVAVDQASERRRSFDLRHCIEDVLAALRPGLKQAPWVLVNEVPEGIVCDTFPGPLGQIITNLVQNAILHGFDGRTHGRVVIAATVGEYGGSNIGLSVTDDGLGMTSAVMAQIFEPFYTTKLGRGGSGLGLSISQRIANTILAGELRCISSPGTGTRFVLTMPQRTPGKV